MSVDPKDYISMPIAELTTPKEGRLCMLDRWWLVKDGCVLFYKSYASPQCNRSKNFIERFGAAQQA